MREPLPGQVAQRWVHQITHDPSEIAAARWPEDLLTPFGLRMARHGMSISRTQMRSDPIYAQQQIAHARELDDALLHQLADQLAAPADQHAVATPAATH